MIINETFFNLLITHYNIAKQRLTLKKVLKNKTMILLKVEQSSTNKGLLCCVALRCVALCCVVLCCVVLLSKQD